MRESRRSVAGLDTVVVEPDGPPGAEVIMLHGYAMTPEALAPFAHSLGARARFWVPAGPLNGGDGTRAWWPVDVEARNREMSIGPRDLHDRRPAGSPEARRTLAAFLGAVRSSGGPAPRPRVVVGFSQGGMLACDTLLHERLDIAALALLSASRIAAAEWAPRIDRVRGLPVVVAHGRADPDLAFSAGEKLARLLEQGGAVVRWVPFDGGHEIPLVVWRAIRALLREVVPDAGPE